MIKYFCTAFDFNFFFNVNTICFTSYSRFYFCAGVSWNINSFHVLVDYLDKCQLSEKERERNVLFNDALNTFSLWLYGVRHMVKDHSDSEKGNPLPPHRLLFPINSKGSFICTIPQTG